MKSPIHRDQNLNVTHTTYNHNQTSNNNNHSQYYPQPPNPNFLTKKISSSSSTSSSHASHVNHGYDKTLVKNHNTTTSGGNEITKIPVPYQPQPHTPQQLHNQSHYQTVYSPQSPSPPTEQQTTTKVASFSIQALHNMLRNSIKELTPRTPQIAIGVALKRESSQLLPQSIEKQMAKNFQSIKPTFPGMMTDSVMMIPSSLETSIENNNTNNNNNHNNTYSNIHPATSKYTDSTSLPYSSAEQSLKDEDAWLPILTIAEEQVRF